MHLAFKRILVATDFGDASQLALEYACVLAQRFGAGLRVVHVVETPPPVGTELDVPGAAEDLDRALQDAQHRISEAMRGVSGDDVVAQVLVGFAPGRIVEYAQDHDIDLIVLGTHGRRGLAHLVVGSVAERVIRSAPCPVFTVRLRDDARRHHAMQATLVAL